MSGKTETPAPRTAGDVTYLLTRRRVKNLNLRVRRDGTVAVSIPMRTRLADADRFVLAHRDWILAAQARQAARAQREADRPLPDRAAALARFAALVEAAWPAFAGAAGGGMPAVKVRRMVSRWGVCSPARRQVTFALALYDMPPAAQEYVVVHELCHLLQPDHSPAFWAEVERRMPDWKARRALLQQD